MHYTIVLNTFYFKLNISISNSWQVLLKTVIFHVHTGIYRFGHRQVSTQMSSSNRPPSPYKQDIILGDPDDVINEAMNSVCLRPTRTRSLCFELYNLLLEFYGTRRERDHVHSPRKGSRKIWNLSVPTHICTYVYEKIQFFPKWIMLRNSNTINSDQYNKYK